MQRATQMSKRLGRKGKADQLQDIFETNPKEQEYG